MCKINTLFDLAKYFGKWFRAKPRRERKEAKELATFVLILAALREAFI
jgi:hypothetical protein